MFGILKDTLKKSSAIVVVVRSLRSRFTYCRALFSGNKCHACGTRVLRFLPLDASYTTKYALYGWNPRGLSSETCNVEKYLCPCCAASDRDRLITMFIEKWFKNDPAFKVLDIAPAKSITAYIKRTFPKITYITMDLYRQDVDCQADITDMPIFADSQFDAFICSHVLEHVPNDRKAMSELHRILSKSGKGIVLVPIILGVDETDEDINTTNEERWRRFGQDDHLRQYGKADFMKRLKQPGFVVSTFGMNEASERSYKQNGLTPSAVLYIVTK